MLVENSRSLLQASIEELTKPAIAAKYVYHPGRAFTRNRTLPLQRLTKMVLCFGAEATESEIAKEFEEEQDDPSVAAVCTRRAQLDPEFFHALHLDYLHKIVHVGGRHPKWMFIGIDGTTLSWYDPGGAEWEPWRVRLPNGKTILQGHLTGMCHLTKMRMYDAIIQPIHEQNEYRAACELMDNFRVPACTNAVFITDRGFTSWNDIAHAYRAFFLMRSKNAEVAKSILSKLQLPAEDTYDVHIHVVICRSEAVQQRLKEAGEENVVYLDRNATFDYLEYGTEEVFELDLRVVRYVAKDGEQATVLTNLPDRTFPTKRIPDLYSIRWRHESAWDRMKSALAMEHFHAKNPLKVMQEIWAKLIMFNYAANLKMEVDKELAENDRKKHNKQRQVVNFTACVRYSISYFKGRIKDTQALIRKLRKKRHAIKRIRPTPPRQGSSKKRTPHPNNHRPAC